MSRLSIEAVARTESGKGPARRLKSQRRVPGVVYGQAVENTLVHLDYGSLQRLLQSQGAGGLIDLKVDGKTHVVLVKDVQRDPVQGNLLHVDFHAVRLDEEVQTMVPIVMLGEEARVNDGGVINQILREISVYCLPTAIPESIEIDVSNLQAGESLTIADLDLPEGVRTDMDEEETVVTVVLPTAAEVEETEEAEDAEETEEGEAAPADEEGAEEEG